MTKRNKDTLLQIALLAVLTIFIVIGGIHERGYYAPASEILLIPLGIGWIVAKRKDTQEGA